MKKFVAVAPSSTMSFCTLGSGVAPLLNGLIGKLPPSSWSWSSVRKKTKFGGAAPAAVASSSSAAIGLEAAVPSPATTTLLFSAQLPSCSGFLRGQLPRTSSLSTVVTVSQPAGFGLTPRLCRCAAMCEEHKRALNEDSDWRMFKKEGLI